MPYCLYIHNIYLYHISWYKAKPNQYRLAIRAYSNTFPIRISNVYSCVLITGGLFTDLILWDFLVGIEEEEVVDFDLGNEFTKTLDLRIKEQEPKKLMVKREKEVVKEKKKKNSNH